MNKQVTYHKRRLTAVGPQTVEVSKLDMVSLPPVPIQQSAPPNVAGTIPEMLVVHVKLEMDSIPTPSTKVPILWK